MAKKNRRGIGGGGGVGEVLKQRGKKKTAAHVQKRGKGRFFTKEGERKQLRRKRKIDILTGRGRKKGTPSIIRGKRERYLSDGGPVK